MLTIAPPRPQLDQDISTVRRFFEAWTAGDVSGLDTVVAEDVVVAPLIGVLFEREAYRGRSGVAAAFREIESRWHRFELTAEHVLPADEGLIARVRVVVGKYDMTSEYELNVVCRLRDGLIVSIVDDEVETV